LRIARAAAAFTSPGSDQHPPPSPHGRHDQLRALLHWQNLEFNAALRVWRWTHSLPRARSFATVLCR
jgi:hypothetical protein